MNRVVKKVVLFNPGLLQKRVIVFAHNPATDHRRVTFISNGGNIEAGIDDEGSYRTCFFIVATRILMAVE